MKKISNKLKKQLYDEAFYKAEKLQRDKQYKEAILAGSTHVRLGRVLWKM